jgi:hypothetical protein
MAAGREGLIFDPTVTFIVSVANGSNADLPLSFSSI